MYASSMSTTACGAASAMRRRSAIGISWPVGLFGVLRKIIRVRGVIAAMTSSVGNAKSGPGRDSNGRGADGRRRVRIRIERRQRDDRFGVVDARARAMWPTAAIRMPSSRPLVSSTQSGSTSKCRAHARTSADTTDTSTRRVVCTSCESPRARAASSRRCFRSGAAAGRRPDRDSPESIMMSLAGPADPTSLTDGEPNGNRLRVGASALPPCARSITLPPIR